MLKVLRALADFLDITLGDLLEGVVLHAFEGKAPFSDDTLRQIEKLKGIYGLTLSAKDSHRLTTGRESERRAKSAGVSRSRRAAN